MKCCYNYLLEQMDLLLIAAIYEVSYVYRLYKPPNTPSNRYDVIDVTPSKIAARGRIETEVARVRASEGNGEEESALAITTNHRLVLSCLRPVFNQGPAPFWRFALQHGRSPPPCKQCCKGKRVTSC